MELKDQVCTMEQGKRLKELGVTAESLWKWLFPAKPEMISTTYGVYHYEQAKDIIEGNEGNEFDHTDAPAYTSSELGEMLPSESGIICWAVHYNDHLGVWNCEIRDLVKWEGGGTIPPIAYESEGDTMAECMADALIHCLEMKLVNPSQSTNH